MNTTTFNPTLRYQAALVAHLKDGPRASLKQARGLGIQALAAGMQTLDLAKLHEQTLVTKILPRYTSGDRPRIIKQAAIFFATTITPIKQTRRSSEDRAAHVNAMIESLSQRTVELASSNHDLGLEIVQRKKAEEALSKSELRYRHLLDQSDRQQVQSRRLSRELLSAQEDERKKISRDLHDVIAQTLTGINIRLATLKREAEVSTKGIDRNISRTQRLVERAVNVVHRFARELRPALLDDLGLIPALQAYLKSLTTRTGVRTTLNAQVGVEQLDMAKRTVLFRVAQEALSNVIRHAKASLVTITIKKRATGFCMTLHDDGTAFDVERVQLAKGGKRLGLIGMRERLAMVGGVFSIASTAGAGTTITAQIPLGKVARGAIVNDHR